MNKFNGFSLIELIVVVAIIGILAVVSVPVYKSYSIHTKIASAVNFAYLMASKQEEYYTKHGVFPTDVTQMGLTQGANPGTTQEANVTWDELAPYVPVFSFGATIVSTCPASSFDLRLANYDGGGQTFVIGGPGEEYGTVTMVSIEINNTIQKQCYFYAYTNTLTNPKIVDGNIGDCVNVLTYNPNDNNAYFNDVVLPLLNSC